MKANTAQKIEALLGELTIHEWDTSRRIASELAEIGPPAVPRLNAALSDKDGYVRSAAAEALGRIADPRAVEPLIGAMQYRDTQVYDDDEDNEARLNAAIALGKIGDLRAFNAVLACASGEDLQLASYAVDALGGMGDIRAIPTLIDCLKVVDVDVPKSARSALIRFGYPAVLPLIQSLRTATGSWRIHALRTLGGIGDVRALDSVQTLLADPDEQIRINAARALEEIQNKNSSSGT